MKHIFIGDIHGRDSWQAINGRQYDKLIFIGDYVDSPDLSDHAILENFKKIIAFKQRHPDKVNLLLGNHDYQYLHYPKEETSRLRPSMQPGLTFLFNKHRELFQIAYQRSQYLCTHAGVTNTWYQNLQSLNIHDTSGAPIADLLNKLEWSAHRRILSTIGAERGGYEHGGPLWADIAETSMDMLDGYQQIVGHSRVHDIMKIEYTGKSTTYIDVLDQQNKFLELEII